MVCCVPLTRPPTTLNFKIIESYGNKNRYRENFRRRNFYRPRCSPAWVSGRLEFGGWTRVNFRVIAIGRRLSTRRPATSPTFSLPTLLLLLIHNLDVFLPHFTFFLFEWSSKLISYLLIYFLNLHYSFFHLDFL